MTLNHDAKRPLLLDMPDCDLELNTTTAQWRSWKDTGSFLLGKVDPLYIIRCSKQVSRSFLYTFVPRLIRTIVFDDSEQSSRAISSTAWMDGLRGFAALAVFNLHYLYNFTYSVGEGYGISPQTRWIHELPVFYLVFDGTTSVVIFFTIAGYVSSYKALQRMTTRDYQGLFSSMPASVFRKWFRLYLPVACSTFAISMAAYLGLFEPSRYLYDQNTNVPLQKYFRGPGTEILLPKLPTLYLQLCRWINELTSTMTFWVEFPRNPAIDPHLWTIVYEFRSCMHLFVALLALAGCKPRIRLAFLVFLGIAYAFFWGHWEGMCFFSGAALAQMDVLRQSRTSKVDTIDVSTRKPSIYEVVSSCCHRVLNSRVMRTFGYCLALYLASYPFRGDKHGGGIFYASIIDPLLPGSWARNRRHKLPKSIAVLLFMYLLLTIPAEKRTQSRWHRILTSKIALYLGKIMFALYLIHGLILHVIGYAIPICVWRLTSSTWNEDIGVMSITSNNEYLFGVFLGWLISLTLALWVADVWEREVESRCARLTKWLENVCFERNGPTPSPIISTNGQAMPVKVQ